MTARAVWRWLTIGLFLAALAAPPLRVFQGPDMEGFRWLERRAPRPFPALATPVKDFLSGVEGWLSDRLAGRFFLTGNLSRLYYRCLGASLAPQKVVIGRDGWLFVGNVYSRTIDQFRGLADLPRPHLNVLAHYFRDMEALCREKGARFLLTVVPDKHDIYPEKLPAWIRRGEGPDSLDVLEKGLREFGVTYLAARPLLMKAREEADPAYLERDSHYNGAGAFFLYLGIMEKLGPGLTGIRPMTGEEAVADTRPYGSDLASILQIPEYTSTDIRYWPRGKAEGELKVDCGGPARKHPAREQFAPSTQEPCRVANPELPAGPTLLFLGDSFGNALLPYLHYTFPQVVSFHCQHLNRIRLTDLLEKYKPQVVIYEIIERDLWAPIVARF